MPKILIVGHARHGKDTVAEILSRLSGLKFISSSEAALDAIWPALSDIGGYTDKAVAFEDRMNNRMLWKTLISLYNTPDKTALAKKILEKSDVYVGMRCVVEFRHCQGLFDHIVWVDGSGRIQVKDESMGISFHAQTMHLLRNSGTLEELEGEVRRFMDAAEIPEKPQQTVKDLIVEWADSVFPDRTISNAIQKMVLEEIPEYLMNQHDAMELADLGILLYDIANLAGVDLDAAIREKMEINKKRTWAVNEITGLMKHVKEEKDDL